ncbi:MAG: MarR family transcriptional regulator [Methanobacteriaceae archaeon]|nr:MarR family transcriptional regulator [Methanobacteriaceae archaeon]MDP2835953.1 MarR family transcriptional regulator [Methanobacteriaceae archaeon]MDP3483931.1 MarR family transcriptional regulator [Methanobacteriaceae archaeon]MDP3622970.1 MarR family transcriptional regulator [Methanobacteriaceae archaeon]
MKENDDVMADQPFGERLEMEKYILVILFLIQQRWGYIINKEFAKDNITTKQWLLLVILGNAFDHDPSMQEMAEAMSTTHQNVKQLATRLQDSGFLKIERDPNNRRILRLKFTEQCYKYWEKRDEDDTESITNLFNVLDDEEVIYLFGIMNKLEKLSQTQYDDSKIN